jgi:predicted ABC-type ATPase
MIPKMIVVAGPPGSGKSTLYPLSIFGVPYFNADDRAAELNGGSYVGISREIRQVVNRELEAFVLGSIEKRVSAIETTLHSEVTFDQARVAKQAGFVVEMRYLALRDFEMHLKRVKARADAGGQWLGADAAPDLRSQLDESPSGPARAGHCVGIRQHGDRRKSPARA